MTNRLTFQMAKPLIIFALLLLATLSAGAAPSRAAEFMCSLEAEFDTKSTSVDYGMAQVAILSYDRNLNLYRLDISSEGAMLPFVYYFSAFAWKQGHFNAEEERSETKLEMSMNRAYALYDGTLLLDGKYSYKIICRTAH